MRLVAAAALMDQAVVKLLSGRSLDSSVLAILGAGAGILLLMGLWTPIAGVFVVLIEVGNAFWQSGDPWFHVVLATLAAGLALLGPGAWSIDARLFGWKRIDVRGPRS